ncbi:reverse transcriptase [Gossypium australe]|uniref:Reverse transcriptase n=1 Tax=Gossypium australe TaxID=47621 RepID=A0A5B6WI93_9ROSI|nr:reverse transcriptase [Gossypium australe]
MELDAITLLTAQGALSSDTKNLRSQGKEHCKAITPKSGTQIPGVVNDAAVEEDSSDLTHKANLELVVEQSTIEKRKQKKMKLGIGKVKPTTVTLQLAGHSYTHPEGKIEDVLCVDTEEDCHAIGIIDTPMKEELAEFCYTNSDNEVNTIELNEEELIEELSELMEAKQIGNGAKRSFKSLNLSECSFKRPRPSIEVPPTLELKPLLLHLKYVYLGDNIMFLVVILVELTSDQEAQLLEVLKRYKKALGWTIADINVISPTICMHKILLEDCRGNSI